MNHNLLIAVTLLTSSTLAVYGEDETITVAQTPAAVQTAIGKLGGTILKVEKANEDGKLNFEVTIQKDESETEYAFSPSGNLLSSEAQIKASDLPDAVAASVKSNLVGVKIKGYEKVVESDKTTYEIPYEGAKGEKAELVLSPDGKVISNGPDKD